MKKTALILIAVCILGIAIIISCSGRGESGEDEDLAPYLYQESFEIWPDPAELYEDARFYFGWKDHDGDMENPTILVSLENDAGDSILLDAEHIDVEPDEGEAGSLSFTIRIMDGYQGDYEVVVQDEAGNLSNPISRYLYVNTVPPEDDDDFIPPLDDDDDDDNA